MGSGEVIHIICEVLAVCGSVSGVVVVDFRGWCEVVVMFWAVEGLLVGGWVDEWVHFCTYSEDI